MSNITKLGYHSHRHRDYGRCTMGEINLDVKQSIELFSSMNIESNFIAYPYGTISSCPQTLNPILRKNKIRYGFTTVRGICNKNSDILRLNRYDCNDFLKE